MHVKRGQEGHIITLKVCGVRRIVWVGVLRSIRHVRCSVLLTNQVHQLLLLKFFWKRVEGLLVNACITQEGLRQAEDIQNLSISDRRIWFLRNDSWLRLNDWFNDLCLVLRGILNLYFWNVSILWKFYYAVWLFYYGWIWLITDRLDRGLHLTQISFLRLFFNHCLNLPGNCR
jgi:hypothetical protein